MTRVLLVTNDFPPRRGGIQSYLHELVGQLLQTRRDTLTVYAPKWKGCDEFDEVPASGYEVVRHPTTLMLPGPGVDDRMRRLIADNDIETVWFGAAAPLALLAPARAAQEPAASSPARMATRWAGRCCRSPATHYAASGTAPTW